MAKKTWIKVKRGLLDPKHRAELGIRIWLYLHILDRANWELGKVLEWKDENEADILEMPLDTLRKQRRQLEDDGYISTSQGQRSQEITIHKWTNPRKYDGEVINYPDMAVLDEDEGGQNLPPKFQGDHQGGYQGDHEGIEQMATLPYDSQDTSHIKKVKRLDSRSQDLWVQTLISIRDTHYLKTAWTRGGDWNDYWLPTEYGGRQDGKFIVICESEDQRAWLEDRGKSIAEKALVGILGKTVEIEFVCQENE